MSHIEAAKQDIAQWQKEFAWLFAAPDPPLNDEDAECETAWTGTWLENYGGAVRMGLSEKAARTIADLMPGGTVQMSSHGCTQRVTMVRVSVLRAGKYRVSVTTDMCVNPRSMNYINYAKPNEDFCEIPKPVFRMGQRVKVRAGVKEDTIIGPVNSHLYVVCRDGKRAGQLEIRYVVGSKFRTLSGIAGHTMRGFSAQELISF